MSKAFGLIVMLVGLYLGMTIYSEGVDSVLGNVFGSSPSRRAISLRGTTVRP